MSWETFTIAYDGPALREGAMDVRDLAPALMALGQLLDAANVRINGQDAQIKLQVRATEHGSFQIALELAQTWTSQVLQFFATPEASGATNLLNWVLGVGGIGATSLIFLTKKLKGKSPDSVSKISDNMMRITIGSESFDVPMELLRLYQDMSVRIAAQKLIEAPLAREGIDIFEVRKEGVRVSFVTKEEAVFFTRPTIPDEPLTESVRRAAFSIVSLAFKEDNKWRLYDGNTQIHATIEDPDFLAKVDNNQVSFSKGDILICDVKITQTRTADGLKTDYVVEKVVEHRPASRQIPLFPPGTTQKAFAVQTTSPTPPTPTTSSAPQSSATPSPASPAASARSEPDPRYPREPASRPPEDPSPA
jgi:hypothetical protein